MQTKGMPDNHDHVQELFSSLDRRYRPEDVAQLIVDKLGNAMSADEVRVIQKASRHGLKSSPGVTTMSQDFARPVGMTRQLMVSGVLFPAVGIPAGHDDPTGLKVYLSEIEPCIG